MGCVYLLTSPSGKRYVGMTQRDVVWRFYAHKNRRNDRPLSRAVAKHGWDNFEKRIVFRSDDKAALIAKEIELIAQFGSMVPNGYNCTAGGEGTARLARPPHVIAAIKAAHTGKVVSETTRAKLRAAHHRGPPRNSFTGRKHSEETKRRISEKKLGFRHSDETKAGMSDRMRNRWAERRAS
jgi:group I intron endonuclease